MTITPARGPAGSRTARNRTRRRAGGEPRHAAEHGPEAARELPGWPLELVRDDDPHGRHAEPPAAPAQPERPRPRAARREQLQAARGERLRVVRLAEREPAGRFAPTPLTPIAELAERLPADEVLNRADAIAAIEALGVDDRAARERYGVTSVTRLGDYVLTHLRFRHAARGHRGLRRAPARRRYLAAALLRCALYLGPLSVAVAAAGPLSQVAWPVPLVTLLLGWSAAQALTSTGVAVARRAGSTAAARLVGAGFAATAGLWCALVWVAPEPLVGHRGLALVIGLGGLATLATVTAALVTRAEAAIVRWSLPCWLLAAASVAGLAGDTVAAGVPVGTVLPAAIVIALVRAFQPVVVPGVRGRRPGLTRPEAHRGIGYLVIGASQAVCVGILWQAGPSGSTAPFWLPLLLAVPILEALIGWHTGQVEAGLDAAESGADFGRHVRGVTLITLAGLLPPLAVGIALAFAAYRLPAGLPGLAGTRAGVLALAGGTLLGGVFAITYLLAARHRTAIAAVLAAAPPLAVAALPVLPLPAAGPLPDAVAVLAATHLAGLLVVALTAADTRRTS